MLRWEEPPHIARVSRFARRALPALFAVAWVAAAPGAAAADPPPDTTADLSGLFLALGPVGGVSRSSGGWDSAAGGLVTVAHVEERSALEALGGELGVMVFSAGDTGRAWLDALVATRLAGRVVVGMSAGPAASLHDVRPPRWGAQGTLWVYAGVVPYVRAGTFQQDGSFVEMGVKIPLPAVRW